MLGGTARFVDDLAPEGCLHAVVVRSVHAHARITRLDTGDARRMPGVRLILTHADLAAAGLGPIPLDLSPLGADGPGASLDHLEQPALARDEVRYVGEPIAFVVADTAQAARDAAECVTLTCEDLPAATSLDDPAAQVVLESARGDAGAVARAFERAAHRVSVDLSNNRVHAMPMEPRGCVARYDPRRQAFDLAVSTQRVHLIQRALADHVFGIPRDRMRVHAPDVGGGFGQKNGLYPEYVLSLEAARRLGQPVKWISDRTEGFASDNHGRDNLFRLEAAADADGRILAVRGRRDLNLGAYAAPRSMVPVLNGLMHLTGVYGVGAAHFTVRAMTTNTASTSPYRGAGRPENVFACERLIDMIARELGEDPVALRRRNLIRPQMLPWTSPLGTRFDAVDPGALLDTALARIDHAGLADRRARADRRGLRRGVGVCLFAEALHGSSEPAAVRLSHVAGRLVVCVGTGSSGHGHETSFLQIASARLGLPMERLGFVQSDTAAMPDGIGTAASWSMTLGGSSVRLAADAAVARGVAVAADLLGVADVAVLFDRGSFRAEGTNHVLGWDDIFAAAPDFTAEAAFGGSGDTVNVGCHACEVEVDPATGAIAVEGYAAVQDCGSAVNPALVEGQLQGGAAQGIGQGWVEGIVYDDAGQILSASLMDYAVPRAGDLPWITAELAHFPEAGNPLGVKGIGESAATGGAAALVNAVLDALAPLGVRDIAPPLTPVRVWQAIRKATPAGARDTP